MKPSPHGHTCADNYSCSFWKDPSPTLVEQVGRNLCQGEPLPLELDTITSCRVLNVKKFRGKPVMNQKKTKRGAVFLSPQPFYVFTQWGWAVTAVKPCDLPQALVTWHHTT